jgi:pimeloyl-ACP methyl ester carboxylesterase
MRRQAEEPNSEVRTMKLALDDEARRSLPGQFVELPDGVVHYELGGPPEGQKVVLVHGFTTPYFVWDHNFQALIEAGFRVLRYDLYGRGYSDRPDIVYGLDLYDRQLLNLLAALDINEPVDLVGLSMGGPITGTFTDRHPELVRRLCLIAPAGFPIEDSSNPILSVEPVSEEELKRAVEDQALIERIPNNFYRPEDFPQYEEEFRKQMRYEGLNHALLSTLQNVPLHNMEDTFQRVGKQDRPVLLIWGDHDQLLPMANNERFREAIPHIEFHAIEEAGHCVNYEKPDQVNRLLTGFLSR